MTALHRLAVSRGDGLRHELLALLEERAGLAAGHNVTEMHRHRTGAPVQAGPNPAGRMLEDLPEGVEAFPAPAARAGEAAPETAPHHSDKESACISQ